MTKAVMASAITPIAGTAVTSLRSATACAGSRVFISIVPSGRISVLIGFARRAQHNLLAVGDAAFKSSGAIGTPTHAPCPHVSLVGVDLVVNIGALSAGGFNAEPDLDGFDGWYRHYRRGESGIELSVPRHMRSQSHRHSVADNLRDSAEGVAIGLGGVDAGDHLLLRDLIQRAQRRGVSHGVKVRRQLFRPFASTPPR